MYHHGCGYPPYGAYPAAGSPGPTMGHDGQLYGPQHYHYATPYYQQSTTPNGTYTPVPTPKGDISTSVSSDQVPVERGKGNSNGNGIVNGGVNGSNGSVPLKPSSQNGSIISNGSYGGRGAMPSGPVGVQDPRFGFDGVQSPIPWLDGPIFSDGQPRLATSSPFSSNISNITSARNQNLRPVPHLMVINCRFLFSFRHLYYYLADFSSGNYNDILVVLYVLCGFYYSCGFYYYLIISI